MDLEFVPAAGCSVIERCLVDWNTALEIIAHLGVWCSIDSDIALQDLGCFTILISASKVRREREDETYSRVSDNWSARSSVIHRVSGIDNTFQSGKSGSWTSSGCQLGEKEELVASAANTADADAARRMRDFILNKSCLGRIV